MLTQEPTSAAAAEPVTGSSRSGRRTATLVCLIGSQILYALSLAPWLMFAGLSVMAFDAPGSETRLAPWLFVGTIWSYPLWLLLFGAVAWLLFLKRRYAAAAVTTVTPLLPAFAFLGWIAIASSTTAP